MIKIIQSKEQREKIKKNKQILDMWHHYAHLICIIELSEGKKKKKV